MTTEIISKLKLRRNALVLRMTRNSESHKEKEKPKEPGS